MVKGTSKRVIVVKSPDPKYFEEAIFIVREDSVRSPGVTKDKLLSEACRAADGYIGAKESGSGMPMSLVATVSALLGSGLSFALLKLFGL